MTKALHKLLYDHVDGLDEKVERMRIQAEEDRRYLENNEDFLLFTVIGSASGYYMDADASASEIGLDRALKAFKRVFERTENGPHMYEGEWGSDGRTKRFHVYAKLAHTMVEIPPSIYRRRLPEEMKNWVKEALDSEKREKERLSQFG